MIDYTNDDCRVCDYCYSPASEEPCNSCSNNYVNKYRPMSKSTWAEHVAECVKGIESINNESGAIWIDFYKEKPEIVMSNKANVFEFAAELDAEPVEDKLFYRLEAYGVVFVFGKEVEDDVPEGSDEYCGTDEDGIQ